MKKEFGVLLVLGLLVLSLGFASAGWFSDVFGKITGNAIILEDDDNVTQTFEFSAGSIVLSNIPQIYDLYPSQLNGFSITMHNNASIASCDVGIRFDYSDRKTEVFSFKVGKNSSVFTEKDSFSASRFSPFWLLNQHYFDQKNIVRVSLTASALSCRNNVIVSEFALHGVPDFTLAETLGIGESFVPGVNCYQDAKINCIVCMQGGESCPACSCSNPQYLRNVTRYCIEGYYLDAEVLPVCRMAGASLINLDTTSGQVGSNCGASSQTAGSAPYTAYVNPAPYTAATNAPYTAYSANSNSNNPPYTAYQQTYSPASQPTYSPAQPIYTPV